MSTDRLKIYNGALLLCGDRQLASLSENREPRHLLDLVWNDGGVRYCLEQAQWHFAMRAAELDYEPSIEPEWGFRRAFTKASDWVNTAGVWTDGYMRNPLTAYADEVGYLFADHDLIYVKYVSDDSSYGSDLSRWPATFTEYVKAYFASKIVHKLPGGSDRAEFLLGPPGREDRGHVNRLLMIAKNKAAMTQPATFPTRGTWAAARRGRTHGFDGGNPNQLIG